MITGISTFFHVEVKSLLISPRKLTGERYKVAGKPQADTMRHKRSLSTFIGRCLRSVLKGRSSVCHGIFLALKEAEAALFIITVETTQNVNTTVYVNNIAAAKG